tara:strand:- start:96 stop:1058 length:963 start_codon:yes stop_codon:yes gene_type:complete
MTKFQTNQFLINDEVNQHLQNIINSKLFATGYIFSGADGLGKKETALLFIRGIFQQYSSSKNINERIINNNHPDLLVVEPTSFNKFTSTRNPEFEKPTKKNAEIIKIEQIRNIKTFLIQKSIESKKKVVLILNAHLLNEAASNCLLKTLEEPSNGIFILLTSKLNALLDTITSRCQLVRFKSSSRKQIDNFLENNLDSDKLDTYKKLNYQDLVNLGNGSPRLILSNIEIWEEISEEIKFKLEIPLKDKIEILKVCKLISEQLDNYQQLFLLKFIQQMWWSKTKNKNIVYKLEKLKSLINNHVQPRLAWEITFLKIAIEDL